MAQCKTYGNGGCVPVFAKCTNCGIENGVRRSKCHASTKHTAPCWCGGKGRNGGLSVNGCEECDNTGQVTGKTVDCPDCAQSQQQGPLQVQQGHRGHQGR